MVSFAKTKTTAVVIDKRNTVYTGVLKGIYHINWIDEDCKPSGILKVSYNYSVDIYVCIYIYIFMPPTVALFKDITS